MQSLETSKIYSKMTRNILCNKRKRYFNRYSEIKRPNLLGSVRFDFTELCSPLFSSSDILNFVFSDKCHIPFHRLNLIFYAILVLLLPLQVDIRAFKCLISKCKIHITKG